jgi:hypothetical protein
MCASVYNFKVQEIQISLKNTSDSVSFRPYFYDINVNFLNINLNLNYFSIFICEIIIRREKTLIIREKYYL